MASGEGVQHLVLTPHEGNDRAMPEQESSLDPEQQQATPAPPGEPAPARDGVTASALAGSAAKPASLGMLALGANGIPMWRRR